MKFYLVSQDIVTGYDTFDSFVCVAKDSEEARNIDPTSTWGPKITYIKDMRRPNDCWPSAPNGIKVTFLGRASARFKATEILCASFNAG